MSKKKRRKKELCPNCKVGLNSNVNFCHNCGQENHEKQASVKMLVRDFTQDYFTFDSKLFRSLKPLLFNPGYLTMEFTKGKRMNYIKPIRLYLFISFIYFLTSSMLSYEPDTENINQEDKVTHTITTKNLKGETTFKGSEEELKDRQNQRQKKILIELKEAERNNNAPLVFLKKQELKLHSEKPQDRLNSAMEKNIPLFLFFTIPILAFVLFLLFYNAKHFYVSHLIFALHYQSFIFLVLLFFDLVYYFFLPENGYLILAQFLLIGTYGVIAAKKTYQVTYIGSFLRLLATSIIHLILSMIVFILLTIVTIILV
jgi:hypothetical protein